MLQNKDKVASLWKNQQGWGSTHTERETFEELFRAYKGISSDSVLTYGKLIPRQESDEFFEQVKALDSTNPVLEYKESSFKTFPLIKKFVDYPLTKVSSNCNHSFVILDEEGNQLRNIIPYDYSDTGIYNYTLRTSNGEEIPWGLTDWIVDTNSSLLTFNNGVPEGVDANNPPTLTFYQYVGPVGERTYIDAALLDVEKVIFADKNPVASFKDQAVEVLDQLEEGFYSKYLFTGSDTSEGIGLQFETLNSVIDSETGDPLKGYDDNSKGQVVSLLSHKTGVSENIEVLFASENLPVGTYTIQVTETELPSKIDLEEGFVVVKASLPGTYVVKVEESETIKAVLLVKDDVTNEFELFYPRQDLSLNLKLPTFIDLKKLPPHLKLSSMSSYSDHITPQYYGPRVADFVIASDDSVNNRSADFVVYNKEGFYLEDAIKAAEGKHIFLRNGTYEIQADSLELDQGQTIEGETLKGVLIRGNINCLTETYLKRFTLVGDITSENETTVTSVKAKKINLKSGLVKDSVAEEISSSLCFNCTCENFLIKEEAQLFNSSVTDTLSGKGLLILGSSNINKLDVPELDSKSIIDTTTIKEVVALPRSVKINSSYVTKFSESIDRDVYPDTLTFPFYKKFEERVYITFDDPFTYDEEANQIKIKLDTITTNPDTGVLEPTIFINEKGELQVRPFFDRELPIEKPELLKTQIEEVYKQHADTTLETEKPTTVKDALIDLYWSKADLKGGKVPIDQLPDSVAYGGLSFVGMWSFEKHNGEYPTFADVDFSTMSDDNYTDLQRGWFFIVEGSTKEDDPCFPQTAIDEVEFTAGDWVVYEGKDKDENLKWSKVDRAYLDPVYSRLPEMAPKTDGENPAWSILDGGEGLLRLSYLSLAEAIRLLNISLLKLSPDRPTEISKIKTVIDYEKTTAQEVTYITIPNDGQLNQLVLRETETAWKSDSGVVAIKQEGKTDLPLETCFYCGSESNIQLMDKLVEVDCQIERFDPYEKWRLGFKAPTGITGALVTGEIPLDTDFKETHQIKITQYDLVKPADIVDDVSKLEGETETLTFQEQRVFESTEGMDIGKCIPIETNLQALNKLLKNNRTGGLGYLPKDTQFTSEFIVKDFTKYNVLSPKAKIELRASFAGVPVPIKIESQLLKYKGDVEDTYDLDVHFTSDIFNGQNYCRGDLVIEAKATNFIETDWVEVGRLKDALVIDTKPEVVESGNSLYPTLNSTSDFKYFGGEYVPKVNNFDWEELAFVTDSFQWAEGRFVDSWVTLEDEPIYIEQGSQSTKVGDSQFKFVTFKKELEGVCDITGFDLILNWVEAPELVKTTNALDKVIVQVCATSPSLNKDVLMDGNSAVPVFYKSTFKEGEACNYPGLSDVSKRRITFGRTTVPIETIYIRIGLPKGLKLKDIDIEY